MDLHQLLNQLRQTPDDHALRLQLVEQLIAADYKHDALLLLQDAYRHFGLIAPLGVLQVHLLSGAEEYAKAIELMLELLSADVANIAYWQLLGDLYLLHGDLMSSLACSEMAGEMESAVNSATVAALLEELKQKLPHSNTAALSVPLPNTEALWGLHDAKQQLRRFVEDCLHGLGGRSMLMYGPERAGKTTMLMTLVNDIQQHCPQISAQLYQSMDLLHHPERLEQIFAVNSQKLKLVVINDFELLGSKIAPGYDNHWQERMNAWLAQVILPALDSGRVFLLASCDKPWHVDVSLLGRNCFKKLYFLAPATRQERLAILQQFCQRHSMRIDIKLEQVMQITQWWTAAEFVSLLKDLRNLLQDIGSTANVIERMHFKKVMEHHHSTTLSWLEVARNYAHYANHSGLYNPLLLYLRDLRSGDC